MLPSSLATNLRGWVLSEKPIFHVSLTGCLGAVICGGKEFFYRKTDGGNSACLKLGWIIYRSSSSNNRRPHPSGVRPSSAIRRRSTAQQSPADSVAGDTGSQPGSMSRNSCRRSARAFCASIASPSSVTAAISRRRYRSGHRLQATFSLSRAVMEPTSWSSSRIAAATASR